jgi:hypothetical protein
MSQGYFRRKGNLPGTHPTGTSRGGEQEPGREELQPAGNFLERQQRLDLPRGKSDRSVLYFTFVNIIRISEHQKCFCGHQRYELLFTRVIGNERLFRAY